MIRRFYVHNYRCLENFELPIRGLSSALLIGNNGAGKTTVGAALEILQKIARGTNRVGDLIRPKDLTRGRTDTPVRFEIEVELNGHVYSYSIAFEFPTGFKEVRVFEERLAADGQPVYTRDTASIRLARTRTEKEASFHMDWHLVALPVIQQESTRDPLFLFKQWLAQVLILRPDPTRITGESTEESLQPNPSVSNFAAWFSGVLAGVPAAYTTIEEYLRQVMPDFRDIQKPVIGENKSLVVHFSDGEQSLALPLDDLSDGEKCFMVCALVLATNRAHGPVLCFWDEPDNYLALSEVGHFITALRKAFQSGGQFIATSHNPEAIRRFSEENTFILYRNSHLEPTLVRPVSELHSRGDLVSALARGDIDGR